jgi:hypothetical protein
MGLEVKLPELVRKILIAEGLAQERVIAELRGHIQRAASRTEDKGHAMDRERFSNPVAFLAVQIHVENSAVKSLRGDQLKRLLTRPIVDRVENDPPPLGLDGLC